MPVSLATVNRLNLEWESVAESRFPSGRFADRTAAEVLRLIPCQPDEVLLDLVRQARAGCRLAARVVVQTLLGKLVTMAVADRRLSIDELLAAVWVRMADYPVDRRPRSIVANLVLDARKDVLAEQRGLRSVPLPESRDESATAHAVLEAATSLGLIDTTSRAILATVYDEGLPSVDAARRHGTTSTAVRWRCSRDVRRLASHAHEIWSLIA